MKLLFLRRIVFIGLGGLALVLPVMAQQRLQFEMRAGEPHPWQSTAYPEDQPIQVSAPAGWAAKITGELATACGGPCFVVQARPGDDGGVVSFTGHGGELLKPGVHAATVEIGKQTWVVQVTVQARHPYLPFVYPPGYPQGCRNSDKHLPNADSCVISQEQPAQPLNALQNPGDTFVDPQFGSTIHRLTTPGYQIAYSTVRAFSANSTYVLTSDGEGFLQVWDRMTSRKVGARFTGSNIAQTVWDPQIDRRVWFITGAKVGYRDVVTGAVVTAADYGSVSGNRPPLGKMDTGGTADNTDDNWWVFFESSRKLICALDLNGLQRSNQEDHLFCANYGELGVRGVDFPQVTQVDSESHKRYVVLLADPRAHVFSVNTATRTLQYEYQMPPDITTPHSDVGQDQQGRQVLFWTWIDRYGDKGYAASAYLNRGTRLARPVEEKGGGLSLLYPLYPGPVRSDAHFGCNWTGSCVVSFYADPVAGGIPNWHISDVTAGTPCVIHTAIPVPFKDGAQVAIGGVSEMAGVNGVGKVNVVDSKTFTLAGRSCSGRYQNKVGHAAEARQWAPASPNRDTIVVSRLNGDAQPVAIHRTKLWAEEGDLSLYWAAPQAALSRDGRYVVFTSNLGLPETNSVYWVEVNTAR